MLGVSIFGPMSLKPMSCDHDACPCSH